ncbi:MAG: porin [Acetobacteraceae bacterium]|nr:porin [Acetobacteraceae bacterium]
MRKLLLASVAALGVTAALSDAGFAQSADDDSGQAAAPAPGTITVRLNGRFRAFGGIVNQGDANRPVFYNPATGGVATAVPNATNTAFGVRSTASNAVIAPVGGAIVAGTGVPATLVGATLQYNKLANYMLEEYTRLYPGFDGVAANGLKYGASIEIRQDNASGAGGGVYGSPSQQSRQRGELYIRREWGYIGTDQLGTVRFGATDGPSSLYMTGNFENFNDGGWNGDVNNFPAPATAPLWPFADVGQLYTTNKVIYLSPQFYGVDFGVAFEPSTANVGLGSSNACTGNNAIGPTFIVQSSQGAGAGCDALASTSTGDYTRRRNTVDAGLRYRGTFGPVGLAATVDYIGSGKIQDSSIALATGNRNQFDGLSVGIGGIAVTYAGLTVGGMAQGGRFNGQWSLTPVGAADSSAWLAGASYTFGPIVVGASYYIYYSPGSSGPTGSGFGATGATNTGFSPLVGQRRERGVAAGGTYSLAPGLALMLSYLWADRKENGLDFISNQTSTPASPNLGANNNYVHSQVLTLGASLTW